MIRTDSRTEQQGADAAEDARATAHDGPSSPETPADTMAGAENQRPRCVGDALGERDMALKDRLADLERRSLLAEQARQLAHRMRTPLNVIELICENLQWELQQDEERIARLDSALDAVSRLAMILNEAVKANRFAPGPPRPVDAAGIAVRVVRLHRGSVEGYDAAQPWPLVILQPPAFEAAIMHCLRLIGLDSRREAPELSLRCDLADGCLGLRLRVQADRSVGGPCLSIDPTLLSKAAERTIRESGGTLSLA
jgi:signal transduction histidine kinase